MEGDRLVAAYCGRNSELGSHSSELKECKRQFDFGLDYISLKCGHLVKEYCSQELVHTLGGKIFLNL
jgi:hypothetical protein